MTNFRGPFIYLFSVSFILERWVALVCDHGRRPHQVDQHGCYKAPSGVRNDHKFQCQDNNSRDHVSQAGTQQHQCEGEETPRLNKRITPREASGIVVDRAVLHFSIPPRSSLAPVARPIGFPEAPPRDRVEVKQARYPKTRKIAKKIQKASSETPMSERQVGEAAGIWNEHDGAFLMPSMTADGGEK